jgi:hypothetical protein
MTAFDPLALSGAKARGKRPYFLEDKDVERLMTVTMALAQEVSVLRERLDTVERLLEKKKVLTQVDIEKFAPSKNEAQERGRMVQEFLARILRVLQQEREAASMGDQSSEDVADELARS